MPDRTIEDSISLRRRVLVFQVGDQRYGVSASAVEQITPIAALQESPGTPKFVAGFLNLAGEPIPVIRVGALLGQPNAPIHRWTPLIILREAGRQLALLVDKVLQIIRVDGKTVSLLPPGHVLNSSVEGVIQSGDDSVLLLSPERLFLQQEAKVVAELQELAQERLKELEAATA